MPKIETYQKQAKLLQRWHRERNYSVGEKLRLLARFRELSDAAVLAMPLPLTLAQEVIAVEAGFESWPALKQAMDGVAQPLQTETEPPRLTGLVPILMVRDVTAAAAFYADMLGFSVDFLHGKPAFYGAVARDGVCLHLRHVERPNFAELAARETSLILASIEVANVKALFAEFERRGAPIARTLARQAWGGLDFHIRDPDGNTLSFVEYVRPS